MNLLSVFSFQLSDETPNSEESQRPIRTKVNIITSQLELKKKQANRQKVLAWHVIGWESGASFIDFLLMVLF